MIKYFTPLFFLCFSCTSSYLLQSNFTVDSKENKIISEKMNRKEIGDFELNATITIKESYRKNGDAWAGILFCTDEEDATHIKNSGYLFYIRESGEVGLLSSNLSGPKISQRRSIKRVKETKSVQIKVIKSNSSLSIWIEDYAPLVVNNIEVDGNYMTGNTGGSKADFNVINLKEISKKSSIKNNSNELISCTKINSDFSGKCCSRDYKGRISEILNYNSGEVIKHRKYNNLGFEYYSSDHSNKDEFTISQEEYYDLDKEKTIIQVQNGTGAIRTYQNDGKLILSGEVENKKFISPWIVYNNKGEVADTIDILPYNKEINDPNEFVNFILEAKLRSSVLRLRMPSTKEDRQIPEPPMQTEEKREEIFVVIPPPEYPIMDMDDSDPIIDYPGKEAQFPGGREAMNAWIEENLQYPKIAIELENQGKVFVEFVVRKDGSIDKVKILRGVSNEIDKEAIRLTKSMPRWIPGQVNDKDVSVRARIPILFKLP